MSCPRGQGLARARTRTARSRVKPTNHEATAPPVLYCTVLYCTVLYYIKIFNEQEILVIPSLLTQPAKWSESYTLPSIRLALVSSWNLRPSNQLLGQPALGMGRPYLPVGHETFPVKQHQQICGLVDGTHRNEPSYFRVISCVLRWLYIVFHKALDITYA